MPAAGPVVDRPVHWARVPSNDASSPGAEALSRGQLGKARALFWAEALRAEREGDPTSVAEAALGLGGLWVHEHRSTLEEARVRDLQNRALNGLDHSSALAQRLRLRILAEEAYKSGGTGELLAALELARIAGEPLALAEGLSCAHHCLLGPHHGELRMALTAELITVSTRTGRATDGLMGLAWRTVDLFLAGDPRGRRSLRELRDQLEVHPCDALGYLVAGLDVMLATRAGDFDKAEKMAVACRQFGEEVGDVDALGWYAAQIVAVRWAQGRGEEVLPLLAELEESVTVPETNLATTAGIAALAAGAGLVGPARSALSRLKSKGLERLTTSSVWMVSLLGICEAAYALGDVEAARDGYRLLAPFADLPIMASLGIACFGSAHRPLGLAARAMGDLGLAIDHLEKAVLADLALENMPCHAISLAALADAVGSAGHSGDGDRAAKLRATAAKEASHYAMRARVERWAPHANPSFAATCQRQGRVWLVSANGRSASVPHSVGMGYLAELFANPGVAIPAIDLASSYTLGPSRSTEPVLDPAAKASYLRHIQELRREADEADECADPERASRARADLAALVEALGRATGLQGRPREIQDDGERARISVRKAIARALDAIADADAALGSELRRRVTTGSRCMFDSRA
jgi:hypothetical protein